MIFTFIDYFEELLKKDSIFIDECLLNPNFLPIGLAHREKEISLLCQLFLSLHINPLSLSRKLLILGEKNTGKTTLIRFFLNWIRNTTDIKVLYINCQLERTPREILIRIIREFQKDFSGKKYHNAKILKMIRQFLQKKKRHLIIVFDNFYCIKSYNQDIIQIMSIMFEEDDTAPQYISLIAIARNIDDLTYLSTESLRILKRNIIHFQTFSHNQIFDILKYRAQRSLKKNAISNEILQLITEITFRAGDIKEGLKLLWQSAKMADCHNLERISAGCVRINAEKLGLKKNFI